MEARGFSGGVVWSEDGFKLDLQPGFDVDSREFLLTSGLGGYCSSTMSCLNTRKYHGLLVASFPGLDRRVLLSKLDEELYVGGVRHGLYVNDYADGTRVRDGVGFLRSFSFSPRSVKLAYSAGGVELSKRLEMVNGFNALRVSYGLRNNSGGPASFRVNPLVNSRSIHGLMHEFDGFRCSPFRGKAFGIEGPGSYMLIYNEVMECVVSPQWHRRLKYGLEESRGEDSVEDCFYPGLFRHDIAAGGAVNVEFTVAAACSEKDCVGVFQEVSSLKHGRALEAHDLGVYTLLANSESFLVDVGGFRSVVAGYHWFNDWGRDSMVSLPGLCMVPGRIEVAERVLERFLNNVMGGRTPTLFAGGKPQYYDYDSALWLIDRVNSYVRYAGPRRASRFLKTYWWTMKDMVRKYGEWAKRGIIYHNSGTWMDTLSRSQAVEVQGLWYNALKVMEGLSPMVGDDPGVRDYVSSFEEAFMDSYWNGRFLDDCLGDHSLRPNQVIVLSLEHNTVPADKALQILDVVDKELLTPYGLRTLSRPDSRYRGFYSGGVPEREQAYHNGTVWPWLLGPYVKAVMRYRGKDAREHCMKAVEPLLSSHLLEAGLGTVSEIFDGDEPHTPRGCISQAWSVAELIRCYFEDIMGGKR